MKILIIGGTGTISSAITRQLADGGHNLWLLNRGSRKDEVPACVRQVVCDMDDEEGRTKALEQCVEQAGGTFDAVCEFIGFVPEQVERDIRLFMGLTKQYVYISSASAYAKPARNHVIDEGTTLANPYWQYSRNKIACEELLMKEYRESGFPVTIVRPSHTYCERGIPTSVHGPKGSWPVLKRMMEGKPIIVHGDGSSLWTLTWNEDFARGFIGLLGNTKAIGEAFQIMSDESLTWNQIYETIGSALNVKVQLYHVASDFLAAVAPDDYDLTGNLLGDKGVTVVFDCKKLKSAVPAFRATTRFDEGVRRCVAYLMAHKELQVEDQDFDNWCERVIEAQETAKAAVKR